MGHRLRPPGLMPRSQSQDSLADHSLPTTRRRETRACESARAVHIGAETEATVSPPDNCHATISQPDNCHMHSPAACWHTRTRTQAHAQTKRARARVHTCTCIHCHHRPRVPRPAPRLSSTNAYLSWWQFPETKRQTANGVIVRARRPSLRCSTACGCNIKGLYSLPHALPHTHVQIYHTQIHRYTINHKHMHVHPYTHTPYTHTHIHASGGCNQGRIHPFVCVYELL